MKCPHCDTQGGKMGMAGHLFLKHKYSMDEARKKVAWLQTQEKENT